MVLYPHLFESFPHFVMIYTVKSFSIVSETEISAFLEFRRFLYDPVNAGNLISASSVFSKPSLNIYLEVSVHIMLKPNLEDIELNLPSTGDECNCPML